MSAFTHRTTLLATIALGLMISWPAPAQQRELNDSRVRDLRLRDAPTRIAPTQHRRAAESISREPRGAKREIERTVDISKLSRDKLILVKDGKKTAIDSGRATLSRAKGDFLIERIRDERPKIEKIPEATQPDETVAIKLPYKIITLDRRGNRIDLRVIAYVHGGGLRATGGTAGFRGKLSVGVQDEAKNTRQRSFAPVEMLITGDVDAVKPERVKLTKTNDLRPIELQALSPREPVSVTIIPLAISDSATIASKNEIIEVPVIWAELSVAVSPITIQGFGLETAQVIVRSHGLREPGGVEVTLATDRGRLAETTLILDEQGTATTTIRSVSSGVAHIEAYGSTAQEPTSAEITFAIPWFFLFFAVAGGMVGSLLRWAHRRRTKASARSPWLELSLGVLAGIVVSTAYAIGINLLRVSVDASAGEALVFVLSALGAYVGLPGRKAATTTAGH